jgi:metal-responsive CopG/Arc/MetJ family transcriptional regulator
MQRLRKDQRVNVRLDAKLYDKIQKLSEESGEAVSVIVRQLLRKSVKEEFDKRDDDIGLD